MLGHIRSADYLVASGNLLLDATVHLVAIKLKMCVHLLVSSIYSLLARRMILLSVQAYTCTEFSVAGLWGRTYHALIDVDAVTPRDKCHFEG